MSSLSPQHVVSTFAQQLRAQPHAMPFIREIRYESAGVTEGNDSSSNNTIKEERIEISFHYGGAVQRINIIVARVSSAESSLAIMPSFVCHRIDCSQLADSLGRSALRTQLQQLCPSFSPSAAATATASSSLLFPAVESVIRILRTHSTMDASMLHHNEPWRKCIDEHGAIQLAHELATEMREQVHRTGGEKVLLSNVMARDVYASLLAAATHSARSCALVSPFPPCFTSPIPSIASNSFSSSSSSSSSRHGGGGKQHGDEESMSQLQEALACLPPLLPLYSRIVSAPNTETAARILLHMTTATVGSSNASTSAAASTSSFSALKLLSFIMRRTQLLGSRGIDLCATQPSLGSSSSSSSALGITTTTNRNWYHFENETCENPSCPPPHWQLDFDLHDPHFDELSSSSSSTERGASGEVVTVFHGSPLANWHCITQSGIQSKSGSKEQTSGALFGPGVYFTDDLRVARNFAKPAQGWNRSALGARIECVGVYDLFVPPIAANANSSGNSNNVAPQPVRRAPPSELQQSNHPDAVPDNYFVVSDLRYVRLKHLLLWRAEGGHPQPVQLQLTLAPLSNPTTIIPAADSCVNIASSSPVIGNATAPLPQLLQYPKLATVAPPPPRPLRQRCLALLHATFSGSGMILAYVLLLLAIVLAQVDWSRTRKIAQYWWKMQQGKRF